jgi:predicted transcriptional regulator
MKTAVSIPDPIFKAADDLAHQLGLSRSSLYAKAICSFLQRHDEAAVTARLDEVLSHETSALDPSLQSIQARSINSGPWK